MPYKDKKREAERKRKYYIKNRKKLLLKNKIYRDKNKEKKREYHKKWYQEK